jgi:hypothetical protein
MTNTASPKVATVAVKTLPAMPRIPSRKFFRQ